MRFMWTAALTAAVLLGGPGKALAGVGAGKVTSSIVSVTATPGAKAIGKVTVAPKDFKAPGPPTRALFKWKFQADIGDPLKPGLAPGRYLVEIDQAPAAGLAPGVETYVTFTVTPDKKCTMDPHATVLPPDGGMPGAGGCGETDEPLCDGPHVGKCEFTLYQAAGVSFYVAVPDAGAIQLIGRIRSLAAAHDVGGSEGLCATGALDLSGDDDPMHPCVGGAAPNPTPNPVIGVVGIAAGATGP